MSKHTKDTIKGILVIVFIEALLLMFVIHYGNYSNFASTDENTEQLVLQVDEAKRTPSTSHIYIYSNGARYRMNWGSFRSTTVRMDTQALSEAIQREGTVIAYIKDGSEVVGLQGEETTYLTVEDYNRYHTRNCTLACIAYAIFQLLHIVGSYLYIRFFVLDP